MRQLTQKLKSGQMEILEVPEPNILKGHILVKNIFSLISAGTESSTVKAARKGYIGKAKERPQQVKQVIDTIQTQGIVHTYRAVMKKLDAYSPLGYSCVGKVVSINQGSKQFAIGDYVACGGLTASHSEIVCVPENLCVKLESSTDLKQAAYNTLGAIAMQGVRQADLRIGETCAVIGLGLIGQITAILLRVSGVRVVGIDIDNNMVEIAKKQCLDLALHRNQHGIEDKIFHFTYGLGCDSVIITAASESLDPINFAGAISRKRGTIVVVGAVPTGFDREPHFYKKELQLKMSCSYGPGRYDPNYEEKGIDYPVAYVRWTEKRNMEAFQDLLYRNQIDLNYLTTHTFKLDDAANAYDMMISKSEPFIGIIIEYESDDNKKKRKVILRSASTKYYPIQICAGFIGAGSYAQSHLIPNIPKQNEIRLAGVMTNTGVSARSVADRFGFDFCTTDSKDIIENKDINTIFIATRHDSHAEYVTECLKNNKNVFVEKPLSTNLDSLDEIFTVLDGKFSNHEFRQTNNLVLMVGYNRRFSPLIQKIKKVFNNGPMAMNYRINSGFIPKDSWIQDSERGGKNCWRGLPFY